jgi:hypothetical protein
MIEKVRINLGGYFQSVDILEVNLLIQRDNLKNGKWKKPISAFKGTSYEILQLFNKKFSIQTQNYLQVSEHPKRYLFHLCKHTD